MYEEILVEKNDGFARVILNKPETMNSITPNLMNELFDSFAALDEDNSVNVIFLCSAGDNFCAGMDLKYALDCLENDPDALKRDLIPLGPKFDDQIEAMSKPVISVVRGNAVAGGFILAYFCDLIIASDTAVFGDAHAKWGLIPGWQEPQRLARSIGIRATKQFFLTGEIMPAQKALDIGLVWQVVPDTELEETVDKWGKKFSRMSLISLDFIKQQLASVQKGDWQSQLDIDLLMRKDLIAGFCSEEAVVRLKGFGKK